MAEIHLRVAELRKSKNMTQQDLADRMGVSFQSISKWENGGSMPDIQLLPELAELFSVSVDQLLGLCPLEHEMYFPEKTDEGGFWNEKLEYLKRTRKTFFHSEYVEYLIKSVFNIREPIHILDCGCGYGYLAQLLLPHLPEGSTYTGVDFATELIAFGKKEFREAPWKIDFVEADFFSWNSLKKYDMVTEMAVLRHISNPEQFLQKMISHTKPGGFVVSIECNREFECDGLYIDGLDYFMLCEHSGLTKKWQTELSRRERDYAIAMRMPDLMRKAGLCDIGVRMDDMVNYVTPETPNYEQLKEDFISYNDWNSNIDPSQREGLIRHFMTRNMTRREAEEYCDRNKIVMETLNAEDSTFLFFKPHMVTFGRKKDRGEV
ncbi:MAG: methyltransferase domain-containing protein [Agathobacter sp.]|nr:methyltransferase domain-containing protein [Agathobacter sp.]